MEEDLESIEELLKKLYKNFFDHADSELRDSFLQCFIKHRENFYFLNILKNLSSGLYDNVLNNIFRSLWEELNKGLKKRDLRYPIQIILISHGSVGYRCPSPPSLSPLPPTPFPLVAHPEDLFFPTNASLRIKFYQPWGVSIDPIIVEYIAKGIVSHKRTFFFYETSQDTARIEINDEELPSMNGWDFNRLDSPKRKQERLYSTKRNQETIPTVWMHKIEENIPPYSSVDWDSVYTTELDNQFIFRYDYEEPLPLFVFTGLLMRNMDLIEERIGIHLNVVVHWASCLAWSMSEVYGRDAYNDPDTHLLTTSIHQYRNTFQYQIKTRRSVAMSQRTFSIISPIESSNNEKNVKP